jgi:hypothetical protein
MEQCEIESEGFIPRNCHEIGFEQNLRTLYIQRFNDTAILVEGDAVGDAMKVHAQYLHNKPE